MRVGYVRCSTLEQNEARQIKMMQEQNAERVFTDKKSGKDTGNSHQNIHWFFHLVSSFLH